MSRALSLAFALTMLLSVTAPTLVRAAADEVLVTELKRPPKEFLDHGDVVGVSPALLQELGISEGDPVRIDGPMGAYIGVNTKVLGSDKHSIAFKKTIRELLGIEEGTVSLRISPIEWSSQTPISDVATFTMVDKPPIAFLVHGDAVGISLRRMMELGARPGTAVQVQGPKGGIKASLQLLDRGYEVISMKETMRSSIGVPEGAATVTLKVTGELVAADSPTKSLYWYSQFSSAKQRAFDDGRPIFVYAESTGGDGTAEAFESLLGTTGVQIALLRARKHRFALGSDPELERQLRIVKAPTMLFLTPNLEEVARFEKMPSGQELLAAGNEATRRVEGNAPANSAVRWHPYNVAMINQTLSSKGMALIYVRLDVAENCEEFERTYLFGDAGNRLLGGKDGYFFDAGKNPLLANQFKVSYAPTMILLRKDGSHEKLEVTQNTNPGVILEFFKRLDPDGT